MEQRPLRLGDTLDDYCPRERRVTNHAIVAMVEEDIKQTRCTTCDAEHAYKGARVPRRRKKETQAALYNEVLAGRPEPEAAPVLATPVPPAVALASAPAVAAPDVTAPAYAAAPPPDRPQDDTEDVAPAAEPREDEVEEGPVHRPLIRATLPKIEGQKEERRAPDFTIRQPGGRGPGKFRGVDARMKQRGGGGEPNGNRTHGGARFGGPRPGGRGGMGRGGPSPAFRGGAPRHGGGKKRSR